MEKGDRVRITDGRQGKGQSGSVFWKGPNKYGGGERLGVRGDDGETYWVNSDDCEKDDGPAPEPEAGPTFSKGDRVAFRVRGREGTGSVFWIGESRNGPGQRLGINDDEGEDAVWVDAIQARPLEAHEDNGPPAHPSGPAAPASALPAPASDSDEDFIPADFWEPSVGMDDMPDAPPLDDAEAERWAGWDDDEGY